MTLQQILIWVCKIVSVFQESVYSCYQDQVMVCHCRKFKQYAFSLLPGIYDILCTIYDILCTIYEIVLMQAMYHRGVSLIECPIELGRLHIFTLTIIVSRWKTV